MVRVPLSSAAISGHQWSSEYLCKVALNAVEGLGGCLIQPVDQDACMPAEERLTKHAVSSEVISGHQWSSVVISGHPWSSVVIRGHQRSSVVISGHQWASVVISSHHVLT